MCVCCVVVHMVLLGKKSPVYGKWKEFYFVIKYGDQQLLYFERENVSSKCANGVCVSACVQCSCLATESQGQGATGFETVSGLCSRSNSLWQVHTCVHVHVLHVN